MIDRTEAPPPPPAPPFTPSQGAVLRQLIRATDARLCPLCERALPWDVAKLSEYRGGIAHRECAQDARIADIMRMIGELVTKVTAPAPRPTPRYAPHSDAADRLAASLDEAFGWSGNEASDAHDMAVDRGGC